MNGGWTPTFEADERETGSSGRERESSARRRRGRVRADTRAQTLPDFAVGIAIFLLAVIFVILFVPQLVLPYEGQDGTVVVDRASNDITGHLLVAAPGDTQLDETCTIAFFGLEVDGDTDECNFEPGEDLRTQLGIGSAYSVNVTLRDRPSDNPNSAVRCEDADDATDAIVSCDDEDEEFEAGDRLAIGPPIPESGSVSMARSSIANGIDRYVIEVGVW